MIRMRNLVFVVHGYHLYFCCVISFLLTRSLLGEDILAICGFFVIIFFPDEESELRDISGRRLCRAPWAWIR